MLSAGKVAGFVEFPKKPAEGIEPRRAGPVGVPLQGQLPAGLRARTHRGRVSRRCVVSQLHPGSIGTDHPGTPDRRQSRGGVCLCPKSAKTALILDIKPPSTQIFKSQSGKSLWRDSSSKLK